MILLQCIASSLVAAEAPSTEATIGNELFSITINSANGHCQLLDERSHVTFGSTEPDAPFGYVTLRTGGQNTRVRLGHCDLEPRQPRAIVATFRPVTNDSSVIIRVGLELAADPRVLNIRYEPGDGTEVQSISPLANVLAATDSGQGYLVVPVREGLLIPANSGLSFRSHFDTYAYEGCHMEMLGVVQNGSAILATWDDPYVSADVKSTVTATASSSNHQSLVASCNLSKSARHLQLRFLGPGDYVDIAKAYRQTAKDRGFLVTWDQKLKDHPERAKLFGAANIKLWSALDRRMSEDGTKEEHVKINWTFDEAAQVAGHFKKDLQLDRVLFTLGGWIHRGYDNQHPDILPTAPECGGDGAFAACARRVMDQGYLFCLHDNYQDIYRDSPSWNERYIMKTQDGKLAQGGRWAGGLAFLTCSEMALELAKRPQNLSGVKKLSNANAYFIDTTYAAGLQECFDPQHPLTRGDDLKWKQALSDYARGVFGVFGSECGREWAIPHSDFFEGLTGVSGRAYHEAGLPARLGATVVPLFELVYRDCIAMYGKYGYDPSQAAAYVLQHISLGRPLNYHSIPPHLYWQEPETEEKSLAISPGVPSFTRAGARQFQITYRWTVEQPVSEAWQVFVHFTDGSGTIRFQNDQPPKPAVTEWKPGEVLQGPFTVTVPDGLSGTFEVRVGLYQPDNGRRALLEGRRNRDRSYLVGKLTVKDQSLEFTPAELGRQTPGADLFTRGDNGWGLGMHRLDRFIKNTYEILSPLNELTARMQMTKHEFLTSDRKVQRTTFGEGADQVIVTVNLGDSDYTCPASNQRIQLPPLGFLVESATFVAFHARNWNGIAYDTALPLFTARSLDGRPISQSHKVRIFHGFGDDRIRLGKSPLAVQREQTVDPNS
jgi:hypothetical protein